MTRTTLSLPVFVVLSGCASLPPNNGGELAVTSLCELISKPAQHTGSRIHIRSMVRPSAHSLILLYDDRCSDAVVVLDVPTNLEGTPETEKMMKMVWEGYPAPSAANTIELYGVYRWEKGEVPSRYFVVESIVDNPAP